MIINVRKNIFETNSSSMHSVSVINTDLAESELRINEDGNIHVELGTFGWGYDEYFDQYTKLSYLATMCFGNVYTGISENEFEKRMTDLKENPDWKNIVTSVCMHTGCKDVVIDYSDGYVDHQSLLDIKTFLNENNLNSIEEFIFGDTTLIIDNDNR